MNKNLNKSLIVLILNVISFQIIFVPLGIVDAQTLPNVDEMTIERLDVQQKTLLNTASSVDYSETSNEVAQEFQFETKTSRIDVNQPITLRFTSILPVDQVLIRIPENGHILKDQFINGESIQHSHGEYWTMITTNEQTSFELTVFFEKAGNYFITIDHDADHFYLEVENSKHKVVQDINDQNTDLNKNDFSDEEDLNIEKDNYSTEILEDKIQLDEITNSNESSTKRTSSKIAVEEYLNIPHALIEEENERILSEIKDRSARTSVRNWSQFRSAWNDSRTFEISLSSTINFSSSILGDSLNRRNTQVTIHLNNYLLSFGTSRNTLEMDGTASLRLSNGGIQDSINSTRNSPMVIHNGSGLVTVEVASLHSQHTAIRAQNIHLTEWFYVTSSTSNAPAIQVQSRGTLTIDEVVPHRVNSIISNARSHNTGGPIGSDPTSRIIIQADNVAMAESDQMSGSLPRPLTTWNSIDVVLTGLNGSIVEQSYTDPNDFEERYLTTRILPNYATLTFNAAGGAWITPPEVLYELSLQASPQEGGRPTSSSMNLPSGGTATINAEPNPGYRFVRWEVVSGGATLANAQNANTTLTMGSSNATVRAVYEQITYKLILQASPEEGGNPIAESNVLLQGESTTINANPNEGYQFLRWEIVSGGAIITDSQNTNTTITIGSDDAIVRAIYEEVISNVSPVDPLEPEIEVDPENKPELPDNQGLLSIDFVSAFNFGSQAISVHDQLYYAQPQRLLNPDGTINEEEKRPNYVQISDRRLENDRNGWQLAVTQKEQFKGEEEQELVGARLSLLNHQLATAQGGEAPSLRPVNPLRLIPGNKRTLLHAANKEGTGTWIYRFGDAETAGESVSLEVPKGSNPESTTYTTTLIWELSSIPGN